MATQYVVPAAVNPATDGPPPVDLVSGSNTNVTIGYAFNVAANITQVRITWIGPSKTNSVNITEWSNLTGAINAQKHGGGGSAVTPQIATTLTTNKTTTLVVAAIQANGTTATFLSSSASPTTGWSALTGGTQGANHMEAEYNIASTSGAFGGAWTMGAAATAGMIGIAFEYSGTPALVNQTEQDNAIFHSSDTITIPATTAGNALVVIVGQSAATTAVNFVLTDNLVDPQASVFHAVPFIS